MKTDLETGNNQEAAQREVEITILTISPLLFLRVAIFADIINVSYTL